MNKCDKYPNLKLTILTILSKSPSGYTVNMSDGLSYIYEPFVKNTQIGDQFAVVKEYIQGEPIILFCEKVGLPKTSIDVTDLEY